MDLFCTLCCYFCFKYTFYANDLTNIILAKIKYHLKHNTLSYDGNKSNNIILFI